MPRKSKWANREYNRRWISQARKLPHKKHMFRTYDRRAGQKLKNKAIATLGGACVRCGFSDYRALEFDHIHGDGYKVKPSNSRSELRKHLRAGTIHEVYQLLCANCHAIKTYDAGEWGHNRGNGVEFIEAEIQQFPLL